MTENLRNEILTVLEDRFGIQRASVSDESRLKDDLDLDSIDLFDILGLLEKKTGHEIELAEFAQVQTLGDFLERLESIVAKAA
jgi:acyl carrier protein